MLDYFRFWKWIAGMMRGITLSDPDGSILVTVRIPAPVAGFAGALLKEKAGLGLTEAITIAQAYSAERAEAARLAALEEAKSFIANNTALETTSAA